jgi:cellulose synthase/poly-beta-1,6-N-acetylglucosamine synthase-like glycosyltransferase
MTSSWTAYTTYLPVWISVFRWGMFTFLRLIPVLFYRLKKGPRRNGDTVEDGRPFYTKADVTAIIPVYQPPPTFIHTIETLTKNGVPKILVVADVTCVTKISELCKDYPNVEIIPETQPGKRAAMATGLKCVQTKLSCFVDDDVQWCDTFLEYLLHPFNENEKIAGVGCEHNARYESFFDIHMVMCDMRLSVRMLELLATSVVDQGASCISGRTACYHTSMIQEDEFYEKFLNEKFFGLSVVSGDDKFLTRYVMNKGGKIWHQTGEKCKLTTTFERGTRFMKQMLRWSRNTWRSDITCLFIERKIWRNNPFTAIVMFDKVITPFFLLYGMFYLPISAAIAGDHVMFVGWLCWLLFSRFVRLAYYFWNHPLHVIYIPFWIIFQYVQAILRIVALITVYERGWGTRSITFVGNTIQRDNNSEDAVEVARAIELPETPQQVVIETITVEAPVETTMEVPVETNTNAPVVDEATKRADFYSKKMSQLTRVRSL